MKKLLLAFLILVAPIFFGACIEDGPLPLPDIVPDATVPTSVDASEPVAPDAREHPADAADVVPDAAVPVAPDAVEAPDASAPEYDAPPATPDAAPEVPDAAPTAPDASTPAPDAYCVPPADAAPAASVVCHGLRVRFYADDVASMHHCTGWEADGSAVLLPPQTGISAGDGVCAVTCYRGESGETVVPAQCSGVWLPGAATDVPRWYTPGCRRLPDHPPGEPDQAGCTWDRRCDLY